MCCSPLARQEDSSQLSLRAHGSCCFQICALRNRAAGAKAFNLIDCVAKLLKHLIVVLTDLRSPTRGHFGNAVNLQGTADGELHVLTGAFEWHDDVISQQLLVVDILRWVMDDSVGDVNLVKSFTPVRQRL